MFDKYGREAADKEHMIGAGPYRLKELVLGQRLVLVKRPDHPEAKRNPRAPDEIVYRLMRETEQRVTALLNDEIQIAHFIPPHLRHRVEKSPNMKIIGGFHRNHVSRHATQAPFRQKRSAPGGLPRDP